MAENLGIVNKPPYFDDFNPSNNYSKILFRPGRGAQSRELTQIQSTLQHQIASLGDKLLTSPIVSGGEFQIASVKHLRFYSDTDVSFLKGKLVTVGDISFKVLEVMKVSDSFSSYNNWAIFFEYKSGSELSINPAPISAQSVVATVTDEVELEQTQFTFSIRSVPDWGTLPAVYKSTETGVIVYGNALLARLGSGVFYKKGFFIVSDEELLLPLSTTVSFTTNGTVTYSSFAPSAQTARVGVKLTSEYITTEEDPTLFDPSAGFYNFAAPGADRLQISPSLVIVGDAPSNDTIELVDIIEGDTRIIDPSLSSTTSLTAEQSECGGDRILKPFIVDIIGTTLSVTSGRAVVNCTDVEIIEPRSVLISKPSENRRFFNQPFNDQCLSDAVIVQSNAESPLFGGVAGSNFSSVNTNYYGSGKIRKLFSDEATRLEIVNCDGVKIGCLTALDIEKNDSTSFRLYYNELQSYIATIPASSLFAEACSLSLDGEKVFTIESSLPLTCSDTVPGGERRLVYRVPRGANLKSVFDADYMITRDFVGDIKSATITFNGAQGFPSTVAEFDMDIPNGVFNDNSSDVNNEMFVAVVNGKVLPLKSGQNECPHLRVNDSRTKMTLVLRSDGREATDETSNPITIPTAGKCYLITKVRFPESRSTPGNTPIPHRKKRLTEARGVYIHDLSLNPTISLGYSDVYSLKSVKDSFGNDITQNFLFDDGQRNDRYDHGSITLLPGLSTTELSGEKEYTVEFRYFVHEPIAPGFYGPITVNSYGFDGSGTQIADFHGLDLNGNRITLGYDEIPNFLDRISGEVISLTDALDFRMVRTEEGLIENGVNRSSILRGRWFPSPDSTAALEAGYRLDLPRIDLLVIREDGSLALLQGEPAAFPVAPDYPKDGCVIAEINVPGTIVSSEDFIVQKPPIKEMTLPELNDMQNRLAELEKAVSIQTLENKARVQSAVLRNEFLTGMVVDDFGGHYVGDVSNDEYNCSMDFSRGTLRAPFTTKFFDFVPASGYPKGSTEGAQYFVTAPEVSGGFTFLSNNQGTSEVLVNPFGSTEWQGYLEFDRPFNMWVDQTTKPVVRNNLRGQNDAWEAGGEAVQPNGRKNGFGTQWGFWKSLWFGDTLLFSKTAEKDRASAKGFADTITNSAPSRFARSIDRDSLFSPLRTTIGNGGFGLTDSKSNRYVDSSLSFFSPENYLIVRGYSLKPNATFAVYFENMTTPVAASRILSIDGSQLTSLATDSSGYCEFILYVPNGSYIVGNKVVKIVETGNAAKKSSATAVYSNNGSSWKEYTEADDTTIDTEFLPLSDSPVILKNQKTLYPDQTVSDGVYQKFFIDGGDNPKGLVLDRVGVYFSAVDQTVPVSVEIRKVDGGEVDPYRIIRNSRVQALPTAEGFTEFVFTKPVYLSPGEYALALRTNSKLYSVHVSERGETRIDEGISSTAQDVYASSVFGTNGFFGGSALAQSASNSTSLRFYIKRKKFVVGTTAQKSIRARAISPVLALDSTSTADFDTLFFSNDNWRITTGSVVYNASINNEKFPLPSNTDLSEFERASQFKAASDTISIEVSTTRDDISPVVDIRKLGLLAVKNNISKTVDVSQANSEDKAFGGSKGSSMKYITRRTDLKLPANVMRSTVEAVLPAQYDIKMYAKVLYEGDLDFDNQPYIEMQRIQGGSSVSRDEFRENVFEFDGTSNPKNFKSFSLKIIVTANGDASGSSLFPELRNLTIVSSVR